MTNELYTYDIAALQSGDILLSTTDEKPSRIIRQVTGSEFSHAMLYTHMTIIHADGNGVFTTNPQRRLFRKGHSIVLRPRGIPQLALEAICQFATNLSGALYSVPEATLAPIMRDTDVRTSSPHQFCSRLVAQAYESAGHPIVKNSDFCFPGQFLECEFLSEVPNAVRPANADDIALNKTKDTVRMHQEHTFAWLTQTRDLAQREIEKSVATILDALKFVLDHPKFDAEVANYIKKSGYLVDYKMDESINPYRYDNVKFDRALTEHRKNKYETLAKELEISKDITQKALTQLDQFCGFPHQVFELLCNLHIERLQQCQHRVQVICKLCSTYEFADLETNAKAMIEAQGHVLALRAQ